MILVYEHVSQILIHLFGSAIYFHYVVWCIFFLPNNFCIYCYPLISLRFFSQYPFLLWEIWSFPLKLSHMFGQYSAVDVFSVVKAVVIVIASNFPQRCTISMDFAYYIYISEVGNRHFDSSSNPGQGCLYFTWH